MLKKQWILLGLIIILVGIAVYQSSTVNEEELPKAGFKAPPFSLQALDAQSYSLEGLEGKPVVINFWASWCGPCRKEAPELVKLYEKYNTQLEIYAVNMTADDSIGDATAFAKEFGFAFPVLLDEKGEVAKRYQVQSIPTTFFVNREGIIVDKTLGLVDRQTLENKFKKLIR